MNRTDIEDRALIERYWQGSLSADDEARFEELFMDSPELQDELEAERRLRLGFKDMAAEDARSAVQLSVLATLAQLMRRPQIGWMAAVLISVLALPSIFLLRQNSRLIDHLGELSSTQASGPLVDVPVFPLTAVRNEQTPPIAVTPKDGWLSLSIDLVSDPRFVSYTVTIDEAEQQVFQRQVFQRQVFQRHGLQPNAVDLLLLTFPAEFFSSAEHRLRLEGVPVDGASPELLATYRFTVAPTS